MVSINEVEARGAVAVAGAISACGAGEMVLRILPSKRTLRKRRKAEMRVRQLRLAAEEARRKQASRSTYIERKRARVEREGASNQELQGLDARAVASAQHPTSSKSHASKRRTKKRRGFLGL